MGQADQDITGLRTLVSCLIKEPKLPASPLPLHSNLTGTPSHRGQARISWDQSRVCRLLLSLVPSRCELSRHLLSDGTMDLGIACVYCSSCPAPPRGGVMGPHPGLRSDRVPSLVPNRGPSSPSPERAAEIFIYQFIGPLFIGLPPQPSWVTNLVLTKCPRYVFLHVKPPIEASNNHLFCSPFCGRGSACGDGVSRIREPSAGRLGFLAQLCLHVVAHGPGSSQPPDSRFARRGCLQVSHSSQDSASKRQEAHTAQ